MADGPGPAPMRAETIQPMLSALQSPIRREILWMVWDEEVAAGDLAAAFDLTAGTVSTHLAALRRAGLVTVRADGNFRRYRADREAVSVLLPLIAPSDSKWQTADGLPERDLARASRQEWVSVRVEVALSQASAFAAFADAERYSTWLGVPVQLHDGHFAAELEWGTRVRGRYEVVAPPDLIAMRWDFEDEMVPVPGRELVGYLRFTPTKAGCLVEVHQRAEDPTQAEFLAAAWSMVLGRLRSYVDGAGSGARKAARPKRGGAD